jgi:large subunit ribosomal protein L21
MHAVLKTGGKQYRVTKNDIISIERIEGEPGSQIEFDEILMIGDEIGAPTIHGKVVKAEILEQKKDTKILVFKKKRRKDYKRTLGHRQLQTVIQIIEVGSVAESKTVDIVSSTKKAVAKKVTTKKKVATNKTGVNTKAATQNKTAKETKKVSKIDN